MATRRKRDAEVGREASDAELLGVDDASADVIRLTDDERATLMSIDADIEEAREAQRRARARASALARQRESCVAAIKAARYDALLEGYARKHATGQGGAR